MTLMPLSMKDLTSVINASLLVCGFPLLKNNVIGKILHLLKMFFSQ